MWEDKIPHSDPGATMGDPLHPYDRAASLPTAASQRTVPRPVQRAQPAYGQHLRCSNPHTVLTHMAPRLVWCGRFLRRCGQVV